MADDQPRAVVLVTSIKVSSTKWTSVLTRSAISAAWSLVNHWGPQLQGCRSSDGEPRFTVSLIRSSL